MITSKIFEFFITIHLKIFIVTKYLIKKLLFDSKKITSDLILNIIKHQN
jgi:hypothetical protein